MTKGPPLYVFCFASVPKFLSPKAGHEQYAISDTAKLVPYAFATGLPWQLLLALRSVHQYPLLLFARVPTGQKAQPAPDLPHVPQRCEAEGLDDCAYKSRGKVS